MSAQLFHLVNLIATAAWILLISFPRWRYTTIGILNGIIMMLCILYLGLLIYWFSIGCKGGFDSLETVMLLFKDPKAVLAGWIHYLAFDLFVGLWITQDAIKIGLNRWLLIPVQILTFMFGPVGFGMYWFIRRFKTKAIILGL